MSGNPEDGNCPEKIPWPSHNALLPMGYFVQVVISDKTYLKCKIGMTSDNRMVSFITNDLCGDNLYKIYHWKQCIMGVMHYGKVTVSSLGVVNNTICISGTMMIISKSSKHGNNS